ncbi:MAG: hypothetical protein QM783_19830 [Phycisphaerales bacterium]
MTATPSLSLPLLQRAQIAAPCHARWEDMTGDDRVRHCAECRLDVYNIAEMTDAQAEALLRLAFDDDGSSKKPLCARIFRRADGTVITANCPVGLDAISTKARRGAARIAAALGVTTIIGWAAAMEQGPSAKWLGCQPFTVVAKAMGRQPVPPLTTMRGGRVCITRPPTPPSTTASASAANGTTGAKP